MSRRSQLLPGSMHNNSIIFLLYFVSNLFIFFCNDDSTCPRDPFSQSVTTVMPGIHSATEIETIQSRKSLWFQEILHSSGCGFVMEPLLPFYCLCPFARSMSSCLPSTWIANRGGIYCRAVKPDFPLVNDNVFPLWSQLEFVECIDRAELN